MRFLPFVLISSLALADSVDVQISNRVMKGQSPQVHIEILEDIAGFQLTLTREGGKKEVWKGGGKPGTTRHISLKQPDGVAKWSGELTINQTNGQTNSLTMEFETEVIGPLKMTIDKDRDVDLVNRKVRFSLNQPIEKVHLKVLMDTGSMLVDDDIAFNGEPAGTRLEVSWPAASGKVMQLDVRAYSKSQQYQSVELTPWSLDIPHDDVNFPTGSAAVPAEEDPKLEAAFKEVSGAIERFSQYARIQVYIIGYTDTVGDTASNRTLSLNRAKSIAAWFRKKGVRASIFYEGFGEEALAVPTTDEQDEPKNRRVSYILSVDAPMLERAPFPPKWRKL